MIRATSALPAMVLLLLAGAACSSTSSQEGSNGGTSTQAGAGAGGGAVSGAPGTSEQGGTAGAEEQGGTTGLGEAGAEGGPAAGTGGTSGAAGAGDTMTSGGAGAQGEGGAAGATETAGAAGADSGGAGAGGSEGMEVMGSDGCGEAKTLQNGVININSGGARKYFLAVPDDYDNTHPYRLVFAFAESGASAQSVVDRNYFTLKTLDSERTTIFVAPDAANGAGSWSRSDLDLTDAILAELESDLCIDKTRIFATGFSFGGAMSLAIACQRADVFRGVAFFSGADLTGSCNDPLTTPIAYYASQASQDSSGPPMPSSGRIKQADFAAVNGCSPEPDATTFPAPGQPHTCTEYKDCSAGHPTKYCVFDGPHGWEPRDPGEQMSWNAPEAWKFITQF